MATNIEVSHPADAPRAGYRYVLDQPHQVDPDARFYTHPTVYRTVSEAVAAGRSALADMSAVDLGLRGSVAGVERVEVGS